MRAKICIIFKYNVHVISLYNCVCRQGDDATAIAQTEDMGKNI
jgi:hypothetical protein